MMQELIEANILSPKSGLMFARLDKDKLIAKGFQKEYESLMNSKKNLLLSI